MVCAVGRRAQYEKKYAERVCLFLRGWGNCSSHERGAHRHKAVRDVWALFISAGYRAGVVIGVGTAAAGAARAGDRAPGTAATQAAGLLGPARTSPQGPARRASALCALAIGHCCSPRGLIVEIIFPVAAGSPVAGRKKNGKRHPDWRQGLSESPQKEKTRPDGKQNPSPPRPPSPEGGEGGVSSPTTLGQGGWGEGLLLTASQPAKSEEAFVDGRVRSRGF